MGVTFPDGSTVKVGPKAESRPMYGDGGVVEGVPDGVALDGVAGVVDGAGTAESGAVVVGAAGGAGTVAESCGRVDASGGGDLVSQAASTSKRERTDRERMAGADRGSGRWWVDPRIIPRKLGRGHAAPQDVRHIRA